MYGQRIKDSGDCRKLHERVPYTVFCAHSGIPYDVIATNDKISGQVGTQIKNRLKK